MKKNLFFTVALGISLFAFACTNEKTQEGDKREVTTLEEKMEDLSATELINNPNTANPEEISNPGPAPVMTFNETEYDFGNIKAGAKVKHTFNFKNTGEAPLIIENATASCGCTVPNWPKEPIAPGATGKIDVEFDSQGKYGQQNKQITIRANTQPNINTLTIKGNIIGGPDASMEGPVRK